MKLTGAVLQTSVDELSSGKVFGTFPHLVAQVFNLPQS